MSRKAQAAMEFLMTYGWAILIVIVAIGAVMYFDIIDPDSFLPQRTIFHAPLPSIDNAVVKSDGTVTIAFKNNVGFPIKVDAITTTPEGSCGSNGPITVYNSTGSGPAPFTVNNGDVFRVEFTCTNSLAAGKKFNSDVTLTYTNTNSGLQKPHIGSVNVRIV